MPFVKLDCGMLDSSLWIDRNQREVFITALLMGTPFDLVFDTPQLKVRELKPTGWVIPSGRYGLVEAAGVGIVRRALVEQEAGLDALEKLASPDPESRSADFEGRRLARIDGGYLILNYFKYRDFDYGSADRSARYREKKAAGSSRVANGASHRDITHADADADAEADAEEETSRVGISPCPHERIIDLYHQILPMCPKVVRWTPKRRGYLHARWKQNAKAQTLDYWRVFFEFVRDSPWLTGQIPPSPGRSQFVADLEWLVTEGNFVKILERKYHRE